MRGKGKLFFIYIKRLPPTRCKTNDGNLSSPTQTVTIRWTLIGEEDFCMAVKCHCRLSITAKGKCPWTVEQLSNYCLKWSQ